jgi:hypothetical protein
MARSFTLRVVLHVGHLQNLEAVSSFGAVPDWRKALLALWPSQPSMLWLCVTPLMCGGQAFLCATAFSLRGRYAHAAAGRIRWKPQKVLKIDGLASALKAVFSVHRSLAAAAAYY